MSKIQYSTETFGPSFSGTVIAELDPRFSRKNAEIAPASKAMPFGLCLMKNADGKYAPYVPETVVQTTGENGETSQSSTANEACAILLSPLPASESQQNGVVLRGYAIVNIPGVVFDESVTDKNVPLAQLEKTGFLFENIAGGDSE